MTPTPPRSERKDLRDLHRLPRASFWSHARSHASPKAPRAKTKKTEAGPLPLLGAFRGHWWAWVSDYLRNRFGSPHEFQDYRGAGADTGVYALPGGDAEVVVDLAGDWGTGTDEAEKIARLIEADRPHYTIHLGDVYYVGDRDEVRENFLGVDHPQTQFPACAWPRGSLGSFALLGNHEMYSRANSYFEEMLPALGVSVEGAAQGQRASFFRLENKHWRIIGLDTGYNSQGAPILEYFRPGDCALRPELIAWLREATQSSPDDPRGVILLSHHQNFSRFDEWYVEPAKQLAQFFNRPVLWFWGHEHRLTVYRRFSTPGGPPVFGRCIGHGGMPVDLPPKKIRHPECEVEFVDARVYPNDENLKIGFNGYARLVLRGETLRIDYVDIEGATIFQERWSAAGGELRRL